MVDHERMNAVGEEVELGGFSDGWDEFVIRRPSDSPPHRLRVYAPHMEREDQFVLSITGLAVGDPISRWGRRWSTLPLEWKLRVLGEAFLAYYGCAGARGPAPGASASTV